MQQTQGREKMVHLNKKLVVCLLFFLLAICFSSLVLSSAAEEGDQYELGVSFTFTPSTPHQTQVLNVAVDIENLGSATFYGQAVLDMENDKGHTFEPEVIHIENLTEEEIWHEDIPYQADDNGIWWATVTIEEQNQATIRLYVDSDLKQEGTSVEYTDSIFVKSLSDYNQEQAMSLTQIGIIVSIIAASISIIGAVVGIIKWRQARKTRTDPETTNSSSPQQGK